MGQHKLPYYQFRHASLCVLAVCAGVLSTSSISYQQRTNNPSLVAMARSKPSHMKYTPVIKVAVARYIATQFHVSNKTARTITREAYQAAKIDGVKPTLVLAVAAVESSYQPRAINKVTGARGLMQILPMWHENQIRKVGGTNALMHIKPNIDVGTAILASYLRRERGRVYAALGHYWGSMHCAVYVLRVRTQLRQLNHVIEKVRHAHRPLLLVSNTEASASSHHTELQELAE